MNYDFLEVWAWVFDPNNDLEWSDDQIAYLKSFGHIDPLGIKALWIYSHFPNDNLGDNGRFDNEFLDEVLMAECFCPLPHPPNLLILNANFDGTDTKKHRVKNALGTLGPDLLAITRSGDRLYDLDRVIKDLGIPSMKWSRPGDTGFIGRGSITEVEQHLDTSVVFATPGAPDGLLSIQIESGE